MTLARSFAKGHEHRVPHETIYNGIYAQPVGEFNSLLQVQETDVHGDA